MSHDIKHTSIARVFYAHCLFWQVSSLEFGMEFVSIFFFYFSRGTESFNQPLDIGLELWLWELGFVLSPALSLTHNECTEVTVGMNGSVHYFIRQQNNTTASHLNSFFMQNHKSPNFRYGTGMSQDDPVCQHK